MSAGDDFSRVARRSGRDSRAGPRKAGLPEWVALGNPQGYCKALLFSRLCGTTKQLAEKHLGSHW